MSDQQGETGPPPAKKFRYQQVKSVDYLYLTTELADIHFSISSNDGTVTRVPAHKILLAADCDAFKTILDGKSNGNDVIPVTDATNAEFKEFLQFFYLNEVNLTVEHIGGVMHLGQKYNVETCRDACTQILKDQLTSAIFHSQKWMIEMCEKLLMLQTAAVFRSTDFLECNEEAVHFRYGCTFVFRSRNV